MKLLYTTIILITITLLTIFSSPSKSFCEEARIENVIVTNTHKDLLVYFSVHGCFTKKIDEAILNGIPTTFTFFIKLYLPRSFWFDKAISSVIVKHTIVYDNLKDEFKVTLNSKGKKEVVLKDLWEAKNMMSEVDEVTVAPMSSLEKKIKYYLKIKAELDTIKLPFFLDYVLFFVSLWDFETAWHSEFFTY